MSRGALGDGGEASRAERLGEAFAPGAGAVATRLEERFDVRYLRFSDRAEPLAAGQTLDFASPRTDLAAALAHVGDSADARAVAAVAQGDLLAALNWNPLVAVLAVVAAAAVPLAAAAGAGWLPAPSVPQRLGRGTRALVAVALALNWLYLLAYFNG